MSTDSGFGGGWELESRCPSCEGGRGSPHLGKWSPCGECNGSGYVPTELGLKFLALVRHNFKPMLQDATDDDNTWWSELE